MREPVAVPAFNDNYIWLCPSADGRALVVDPGQAAPVIARLQHLRLDLAGILLTHHHADHTGGVDDLLRHYRVPVYAPDDARIATASVRVGYGALQQFALAGERFEVIDLAGHTRSHVGYLTGNRCFVGDTLFSLGCGRVYCGTAPDLYRALSRLAALPDETQLYAAHEYTEANLRFALSLLPDDLALASFAIELAALRAKGQPSLPTTVARERLLNPFLRTSEAALTTALASIDGRDPGSAEARFVRLRELKDTYA